MNPSFLFWAAIFFGAAGYATAKSEADKKAYRLVRRELDSLNRASANAWLDEIEKRRPAILGKVADASGT